MGLRNKISELDLFKYTFYRNSLEIDKITEIEQSGLFNNEIAFYEALKESVDKEFNTDLRQRIALKIPAYRFNKTIFLYPVQKNKDLKKNGILVLAADSPQRKIRTTSKTFIDEENDYLVKVINLENSSKLYVFSLSNEQLKNYKLILYPSGEEFNQKDNSLPLEINSPKDIEKIELQFIK